MMKNSKRLLSCLPRFCMLSLLLGYYCPTEICVLSNC
jgi:hypothetical protein